MTQTSFVTYIVYSGRTEWALQIFTVPSLEDVAYFKNLFCYYGVIVSKSSGNINSIPVIISLWQSLTLLGYGSNFLEGIYSKCSLFIRDRV